jgi:L,D-peptidoglycan transpeptidase YkuD (ErfK/YbiS/YcfS/YnhG family)
MSFGRAAASGATCLAVAGLATVAVAMSRPHDDVRAGDTVAAPTTTAYTYAPPETHAAPAPAVTTTTSATTRPAPIVISTTQPAPAATTTSTTPAPTTHTTTQPAPVATTTHTSTPTAAPRVATTVGQALPLRYTTGTATQVITVTARSTSSSYATVQAWSKASGGGWLKRGSAISARIGSQGMTRYPSESKSATPIGSYTLTQAFGYYANPGTTLRYFKTTWADWWISTAGPLYNTHQRCSTCGYHSPDEHLVTETPYYNYAVVIDYNTRNSPTGVRQGAGSAFFLHVHPSGTGATAGCVAIPQSSLVSIMRWLTPTRHPRILIGVT